MIRQTLSIVVLSAGLAASASANRTLVQPEAAYEIGIERAVLPFGGVGPMSVRPCADCEVVSLSATAATEWFMHGGGVRFADFAAALEGLRRSGDGALYVYYDVASRQVRRVVLDEFTD